MTGERRRLRALWRRATDDPYRKLVAIGLAVLMWFFIDSRITKTTTREMPLRIAGASDGEGISVAMPPNKGIVHKGFFAGGERITRVTLVLTGPRYRIEALEGEPLNLQITEFLSLGQARIEGAIDDKKEHFVEFSAASIQLDQRLRDVSIRLEPARVRIRYEVSDNFSVSLSDAEREHLVDIQAPELAGRLRPDTARYTPEVATIVGSAFGMEQLKKRSGDSSPMFRVRLEAPGSQDFVRGELEIIGGDELGLRLEPTPYLFMELLPQTSTFSLRLPVVVDDLSLPPEQRGKYAPVEPTRSVRVRAAGELRSLLTLKSDSADGNELQAWAEQNLRLHVYVPRPEAGYAEEMNRQAIVMPAGPLLGQIDRNECSLADPVVVTLRRR